MKLNNLKKVSFKTLGCRLNQYETDAIASDFISNNYRIVDFGAPADVYIVNTCTVTNQGDQKSRQEIHRVTRDKKNGVLVLTGCMVNNYENLKEQFPEVDYFVENTKKKYIREIVDSHFQGEILPYDFFKPDVFGFLPAEKTFHTRSMIKIQDGCDNFCTYCIVPKVRGRAVSRPPADIKENVMKVIGYGFKEIVLTGVNIGRYHYENYNFEKLVEELLELPGDFRIRISSIEPEGFGHRLFDLFSHPKLANHLHLCLQSGSDNILLRMRRFYSLDTFIHLIEKIRKAYPHFNFTTDIIVGFPGETEADFLESVKVVKEIGFTHIHTFKYSVRNGTRAARMPDQVSEKTKTERSRIIRELSDRNKLKYHESLIGKKQRVLVERKNNNGFCRGLGEYYVPVKFKHPEGSANEFYIVQLTGIHDDKEKHMNGEIVL